MSMWDDDAFQRDLDARRWQQWAEKEDMRKLDEPCPLFGSHEFRLEGRVACSKCGWKPKSDRIRRDLFERYGRRF